MGSDKKELLDSAFKTDIKKKTIPTLKNTSKSQIAILKRNFNAFVNNADFKRADNAFNALPEEEQMKVDKSHYFSRLIEHDEIERISEIMTTGSDKDRSRLQDQCLKIENNLKLQIIIENTHFNLKPMRNSQPVRDLSPKTSANNGADYFSKIKNRFNILIGKSLPISPEGAPPKSVNKDIINHSETASTDSESHTDSNRSCSFKAK